LSKIERREEQGAWNWEKKPNGFIPSFQLTAPGSVVRGFRPRSTLEDTDHAFKFKRNFWPLRKSGRKSLVGNNLHQTRFLARERMAKSESGSNFWRSG
jgi:hypothetical protein